MSRSTALLKRLLPKLYEDLEDELVDDEYSILTKDIVEELCDDVLEHCAATVAEFKRAHNAGRPHSRLPPEIWCLVWSLLRKDSQLVAVTHVCRAWRAIAIDYAPLWRNVHFFTTVHSRVSPCGVGMCDCYEATLWDEDEEPQAIHNLPKVQAFFERSKNVRVSMDIRTYPLFSDQTLADQLAEVVQPHAHRIASLTHRFGDLAFFIRFMQHVGNFQALDFLRLQHSSSVTGEQDNWPMSTMQLERLSTPRLREFRGYNDIWWDIPRPPDARSLQVAALEHLRCDFRDTRAFYHCLRVCPNLVFLNSDVGFESATNFHSAPPEDALQLVPRLRDLILDRVTPYWETIVRPILRRPALRKLTLRVALRDSAIDDDAIFHCLRYLTDDIKLVVRGYSHTVNVEATDRFSRSHWLELHGQGEEPPFDILSVLWNYIQVEHIRSLTVSWALRAALLSKRLIAPGLSRIRLVVEHSDVGPQRGIDELIGLNNATVAGRPSFPNLAVLEVRAKYHNVILPATSVHEFAAALTDREYAIELFDVVLQDDA